MASIIDKVVKENIFNSVDYIVLSDGKHDSKSEPYPIKWSCHSPDIVDNTSIRYYEWKNYDGCPHSCCQSGPVSDYVLNATGINFSSFRITVERNIVNDNECDEDDEDKDGISYIQISIDKIDDFIDQYGHITELSNFPEYNCPEALDFMELVKDVRSLWKKNQALSWDEIIVRYNNNKRLSEIV
jgi:hypothetical protein